MAYMAGYAQEGWDKSEEVRGCGAGVLIFKTIHLVESNFLRLFLQMSCYLQNITKESFPLMRQRVTASLCSQNGLGDSDNPDQ